MTMSARDRRALLLLGIALIIVLVWRFGFSEETPVAPVDPNASLPVALLEKRLVSLRQRAALNPSKQDVRDQLAKAVEEREKALLRADTPQQAQAALLAKMRDVLESQDPALQSRQVEMGAIVPAGEDYGEVAVTVGFVCAIENLVNVLADVAAFEEAIATKQITVSAMNRKDKQLNVRLTVSALTPRDLLPEQPGATNP